MNRYQTPWAIATALVFAACATDADLEPGAETAAGEPADGVAPPSQPGDMPTLQGPDAPDKPLVSYAPVATTNGIGWSGGSVMHGTPTLYFIFYGNAWGTITTNTAWRIFEDWAKTIGGSAYYGINTSYYDSSGDHVLNAVRYGGLWYDSGYSQGKSLNDTSVKAIVQSTIDNNQLPADLNAIYMVLAASDVNYTANTSSRAPLCNNTCAFHDHRLNNLADYKYAFIGNTSRCPSVCTPSQNRTSSPNGNTVADAMVNWMSHELVETVTDPDYNAWTNTGGNENADLCNPFAGNSWGPTTTLTTLDPATNGSTFNVTLGGRNFLLPQNWLNANGGSCTLSYPHSTLRFDAGDSRLFTATGDWRYGSYKSECGPSGAVTGLSNDWSTKKAHSAFCTDASAGKFPHNSCTVVDFTNGDNRRTTWTGDWDAGFPKSECGPNEYVAGVSQQTNGFVNAILCCPGNVSHASCSPRYNYAGDSRESTTNGDWDPGYVKLECGPNRYVAGVARNTRAGQPGGPDAVLCCQ